MFSFRKYKYEISSLNPNLLTDLSWWQTVFLFQKTKLAVVFLFFTILRSLIFQEAVLRLVTQVFIGVVYCSFFASGDPVPLPIVLEEESLAKPTIHSVHPVSEQLTYRIIDDGTIHRKKKLIDSRGCTYNVRSAGKRPSMGNVVSQKEGLQEDEFFNTYVYYTYRYRVCRSQKTTTNWNSNNPFAWSKFHLILPFYLLLYFFMLYRCWEHAIQGVH